MSEKIMATVQIKNAQQKHGSKGLFWSFETSIGWMNCFDEELAVDLEKALGKTLNIYYQVSKDGKFKNIVYAEPTQETKLTPAPKEHNGQRKGMLFNNAVQLYMKGDYEKVEGVVGYDYILLIAKKLESLADQFDK